MFVHTVMKTQNTMMRFLYSFDETFMDKEVRFGKIRSLRCFLLALHVICALVCVSLLCGEALCN